jgi:hypothetical protein
MFSGFGVISVSLLSCLPSTLTVSRAGFVGKILAWIALKCEGTG